MPPLTRIICLANSRKHGAYCIAGISLSTGGWIRPVSSLDDGRVERRDMLTPGRPPVPGDIIGIPLASTGPDFGFECENRLILQGDWIFCGTVDAAALILRCGKEPFMLHNDESYVTVQHLQTLAPEKRRTLQLVEALDFVALNNGMSAQGGHKWNGSFVSPNGRRMNARITDPALVEKLEQGYLPARHCIVTVSLSMPYKKPDQSIQGDPCWKLIAAVLELEPGTWPATTGAPAVMHPARSPAGPVADVAMRDALKRVFGFDTFRPDQEGVVRAILDAKDCIAVMPTGGGKSLCYQLPAHLLDGTCVVISPLISLMKDQVDGAVDIGLRAAALCGAQSDTERIAILQRLAAQKLDLLYVSPERVAMETFLNNLARVKVCLIAIDEAHCISEWGHDFRPEYLELPLFIRRFPGIAVAAFTATATHQVQRDIVTRLGLRDPHTVRASFDRPNLYYEIVPKHDVTTQIIDFVRAHTGVSGVVYRTTRQSVEDTVTALTQAGIQALPYHAGMDAPARQASQEAFDRDSVDVIVATVAFGMGIDKPSVRYVLHGDLPKNMESYYQETGRAGRDGEPARCVLLFGRGDIPKIRYFIDKVEDAAQQRRLGAALNEMVVFAGGGSVCRRKKILAYFGEEYAKSNCDACDVCRASVGRRDVTADATKLLAAIIQTRERFGTGHIADILAGGDTVKIRRFNHDRLPSWGSGRDHTGKYWRQLANDLLELDFIRQNESAYPVPALTDAGRSVIDGNNRVLVVQRESVAVMPLSPEGGTGNETLFQRLRMLRKTLAAQRNVPPYVVFADRTLHEMSRLMPADENGMQSIHGVGEVKLATYGAQFLAVIREFAPDRQTQPTVISVAPIVRHAAKPGATCEATRELVHQGMDINGIARQRNLSLKTIAAHIEQLILDGCELDIDRYVPPDIRRSIEQVLPTVDANFLRQIVDALPEPVSWEHARLARAWARRTQSGQPGDGSGSAP